jgi:hypothetical protein
MGLFDKFKKKPETNPTGPDYSKVDSNEKAFELFQQNQLSKLYLMPLDCGGADSPMNTLFVPEFASQLKHSFDHIIIGLLEQGHQLRYSAKPEYDGASFVPNRITIQVSGDKSITETIHIW